MHPYNDKRPSYRDRGYGQPGNVSNINKQAYRGLLPPPRPPSALPPQAHGQTTTSAVSHNPNAAFPSTTLLVANIGIEHGSHMADIVYEIKLGDVCVLDALHIVPLNSPVPGPNKFIGKTRPDINTRPFVLKMFMRNVETGATVAVNEWTISGGVQFLPLPPHFQSSYTDYIAFSGTFDMLTILVHGMKWSNKDRGSSLKAFPYFPASTTSFYINDNDDIETHTTAIDEDLEADEDDLFSNQIKQLRHLLTMSTHSVNKRLKKLHLRPADEIIAIYHDRYESIEMESVKVSRESIGNLIGLIFTINLENVDSLDALSGKVIELESLAANIKACWETASAVQGDDCDPITALGEDTAIALANILIRGLEYLRIDIPNILTQNFLTSSSSVNTTRLFRDFSHALLDCCELSLMNQFLAKAFLETHGLTILSFLARQQPTLPSSILLKIVSCFQRAVAHYKLAESFFELSTDASAASDISGYQTLVYILGNSRPSATMTDTIEDVLSYGALYDSCCQIRLLATSAIEKNMPTLNEMFSLRLNASSSLETFNSAARSSATDSRRNNEFAAAIRSSKTILEEYLICLDTSEQLLSKYISEDGSHVGDRDSRCDILTIRPRLMAMIHETKYFPSIVSMLHYLLVLKDLCIALDWNDQSQSHGKASPAVGLSVDRTIAAFEWILSLGNIEILLSQNHESVQHLWDICCNQYAFNHSSILLCQSHDELSSTSHRTGSSMILPRSSFVTMGWIPFLSVVGLSYIEKVIASLRSLTDKTASHPNGMMSSEEIESWMDSSSLHTSMSNIDELCYSPCGLSIVLRIIAQYALPDMIKVFDLVANSLKSREIIHESDLRSGYIVNKLMSLAILCSYVSEDPIVQSILKPFKDRISFLSLIIVSESYLEEMERSAPSYISSTLLCYFKEISYHHNQSKMPAESERDVSDVYLIPGTNRSIYWVLKDLSPSSKLSAVISVSHHCRKYYEYLSQSISDEVTIEGVDLERLLDQIVAVIELLCRWCRGCVNKSNASIIIDPPSDDIAFINCPLDIEDDIFDPRTNTSPQLSGEGLDNAGKISDVTMAFRRLVPLLRFLHLLIKLFNHLQSKHRGIVRYLLQSNQSYIIALMNTKFVAECLLGRDIAGYYGVVARLISTNCDSVLSLASDSIESKESSISQTMKGTCIGVIKAALCYPMLIEVAIVFLSRQLLHHFRSKYVNLSNRKTLISPLFYRDSSRSNEDHSKDKADPLVPIESTAEVKATDDRIKSLYDSFARDFHKNFSVANDDQTMISQLLSTNDQRDSSEEDFDQSFRGLIRLVLKLSSSSVLHDKCVNLMVLYISISNNEQSEAIIKELSSMISLSFQAMTMSGRLSNSKPLLRLLVFLDKLLAHDKCCLLMLHDGFLARMFEMLLKCGENISNESATNGASSIGDVILVLMQCITTTYRTVTAVVNQRHQSPSETENKSNDEKDKQTSLGSFDQRILLCLYQFNKIIVYHIPKLMIKIIELTAWQVIGQCMLLISLLPAPYIRLYVEHSISTIASVEVFAVKLWIAMEEAYQQLIEATEIRKNIVALLSPKEISGSSGLSIEDLPKQLDGILSVDTSESAIAATHQVFASTCYSLKLVLDLAYSCYIRDIIPLPSLARAIRSSLALDPRKLIMRMQRSYTMWCSENPNSYALSSAIRSHKSGAESLGYLHSSPNIWISMSNHPSRETNGHKDQRAGLSYDISRHEIADSYDANHFLCMTSLKHISDLVTKANKFVVNKEDKQSLLSGNSLGSGDNELEGILQTDLAAETVILANVTRECKDIQFIQRYLGNTTLMPSKQTNREAFDEWMALSSEEYPLLDADAYSCRENMLHDTFRRGLVHGDESHVSVYDPCYRKVNRNVIKSIYSPNTPMIPVKRERPPINKAKEAVSEADKSRDSSNNPEKKQNADYEPNSIDMNRDMQGNSSDMASKHVSFQPAMSIPPPPPPPPPNFNYSIPPPPVPPSFKPIQSSMMSTTTQYEAAIAPDPNMNMYHPPATPHPMHGHDQAVFNSGNYMPPSSMDQYNNVNPELQGQAPIYFQGNPYPGNQTFDSLSFPAQHASYDNSLSSHPHEQRFPSNGGYHQQFVADPSYPQNFPSQVNHNPSSYPGQGSGNGPYDPSQSQFKVESGLPSDGSGRKRKSRFSS